ncbi:hypothetical protein ACFPVS_08930 [Neisseria weixii]|uniref:Uncharacterized protein n=1 Tax=Neisseria weixii TaxID=1853276 RepID=A0A3N4MSL4_9NEIS|nr:hypothetical protein [Neisseria weixii]ATD64121.1 hypothetical protein CGZ65_00050 [Neisseria weixii]ATD65871.1 hypothetical protein CGZ65_12540 [Neisseria weixii]RPD86228.1 hypothetical protein EGK74_08280 [Neisseria weixii]RPD87212.1 hypothetical protein EGK75_07565 [Neisseria weixii]
MLTDFKVYRGNIEHAGHRYDDDLYRVWLAQPGNRDKSFDDFTEWLAQSKSSQEAPDFVARFILALN